MKRVDQRLQPAVRLTIRLFGSLEIRVDDHTLDLPSSAKIRSLLAYLIFHHDYAHPRDRLTGTFWPDRPDSRARRALSNALWQVRRSLDAAASRLVTEGDTVLFALHSQDWLDVEEFERNPVRWLDAPPSAGENHLRTLRQTERLYRADFLEGLYDDWVLLERERLRERYLDVLERLIAAHKQADRYQQALLYAQRLVAADPLRELAHREVMRLYHLMGRSQTALDQFEVLRRLLEEELDAVPTPKTAALYREIATAMMEVQTPYLPVAVPVPPLLRDLANIPFVGRRDERAALLEALQAAAQGRGGVALVEGSPGAGKTRLIEEVLADAEWRAFQVSASKVDSVVAASPYQPLRNIIAPLLTPLRLAQLAGLLPPRWLSTVSLLLPSIKQHVPDLPSLPPLGLQAEREQLWNGIAHVLKGLAVAAPLLVVIEDIHWADDATLAALPGIVSQVTSGRILLILSYRSAEARKRPATWEALEKISRSRPPTRITLSPLTEEDTVHLIQRALAANDADERVVDFARRLHQESNGNAFFLIETLKALLEYGTLSPEADGTWRLPPKEQPLPTPASIQALIGGRLSRLTPALYDVLRQVAVLGDYTDFAVLSYINDTPVNQLVDALSELCEHGFLIETETGYRFEHDLIQMAVYDAIDPDRLAQLHRYAGEAMEAHRPEDVAPLARHFERGGAGEKALIYARQAAAQALAIYETETALAYLRQAQSLVGDDPAAKWAIMKDMENTLDVLSRREEQRRILDEMLALAEALDDPARRAHTLHRRGWCDVLAGDPSHAIPVLEEAAGLAKSAGEQDLYALCLTSMARAWWRTGEMAPCQRAIEEAEAIFHETGNLEGETQVLNMLGNLHLGMTGDYAQALRCFERTRQINEELGRPYHATSAHGNEGITLSVLGQHERSREILNRVLETMREVGNLNWQGIAQHWQAVNYHAQGQLDAARSAAESSLRICRQAGNVNFEIGALERLGIIALVNDEPLQASDFFRQARDVARANQQKVDLALNASYLALSYLRLGELDRALHLSDETLTGVETLDWAPSRLKDILFNCYQVALETGGTDAAKSLLDRAYQHLMEMAARIQDPILRDSFLENVPENRMILLTYHCGDVPLAPQRKTVSLAAVSAPTGRPLRAEEMIEVMWTLVAPEDAAIEDRVARRRHRLLRLLQEAEEQSAAPTASDLADALDVSKRTIQRDLTALRAAGHEVRTRGSR